MIWQLFEETEYSFNYKVVTNPLVISFNEEIDKFFNQHNEHLCEVCLSNSSLRYVLRIHLNPKLIKKNAQGYESIILGKHCTWKFIYQLDTDQPGEYVKTLKMGRDDSINQAIKFLQDQGLSGYVLFNEDIISRYKDDPESQEFESWLNSFGID